MQKKDKKMQDDLIKAAQEAQSMAYAPYSKFQVGAAIKSGSGVHRGCNVENAAYPEGTCAEAGAIAAMIMAGDKRIERIVVIGSSGRVVVPCGGCRQKIAEFASPTVSVLLLNNDMSKKIETSVGDLLPHAFSDEWL